MSEYQPGDRVRLPAAEAVVDAVVPGGRVYIDGEWYDPDDLTLIDRPAPPLPTEPGTTGYATVRGEPGVRVMRHSHTRCWLPWFSASDADQHCWHADSDLRDFIPDPDTTTICEDSGYSRYVCQAIDLCDCFEPRVVPDDRVDGSAGGVQTAAEPPCKCGHTSDAHERHSGPRWCHRVGCYCPAYRPAQPDGCTCTRDTSGHIVSLDPTCPARDADPTPEPDPVCECGHGRDEHDDDFGCITQLALCPCTAYRPAPTPQPEPFTFQRDDDGTLSMESAVFQALGAASTCWEHTPTGVFDSDRAREIGDALLAELIDRLTKKGSE